VRYEANLRAGPPSNRFTVAFGIHSAPAVRLREVCGFSAYSVGSLLREIDIWMIETIIFAVRLGFVGWM